MAVLRGTQMTLVNAESVPDPGFVDGTVRVFAESVTYATQTTSDTIEIARLPKGAIPLYGVLTTSVTTATATIAIGITGTTGKYRAAAAATSADVPEVFGITGAMGVAITAAETVFITIGTASLPASGTLTVQFVYAFN